MANDWQYFYYRRFWLWQQCFSGDFFFGRHSQQPFVLIPPMGYPTYPPGKRGVEQFILPEENFQADQEAHNQSMNMPVLLNQHHITVLVTASAPRALAELTAQLVLRGPLQVLDGGNVFPGYALASALRHKAAGQTEPERFVTAALAQVMLSRVFTCYQMAALLAQGDLSPQPLLVLDFLATFYDQNVRIGERQRLLRQCIQQMKAAGRRAPLVIWLRQQTVIPEDALEFLPMVTGAADAVWRPAPVLPPAAQQLSLFPAE